jgi:adenylate cyclase
VTGEAERPHWSERRWIRALRRGRGRPGGLLLLGGLVALLLAPDLGLVTAHRVAGFDAYQALAPRRPDSWPAVIVAVDEASLKAHGQWPWPRVLVARLLAAIAAARPAAIGVDVVMAEPDRLSPDRVPAALPGLPPEVAERVRALGSSDVVLAEVVRGLPLALGVAGLRGAAAAGTPAVQRRARVIVRGGDPRAEVFAYQDVLRSVEPIDAAAAGHGLINADPERGIVRRLPMVARVGDALLPSLGLEMLRLAAAEEAIWVEAPSGRIVAVGVGAVRIPTERDGGLWIHYAPGDGRRFVSAADVLAGTVDAERLERKLVLVGVTALGLTDYHATPVGDRMPGVEIHAQVLEGIFDGAQLSRPWWFLGLEIGLLVAGGLALIALMPAVLVRLSVAVFLVMLVLLVAAGAALYGGHGLLLDVASPALGLGLVFTLMLGVSLSGVESQRRDLRRQLQEQREAAARLAGELEAARRIQMGILPRPADLAGGGRRFDLYAFLEPARVVGGDLYDFFLLDDRRLFFLIGDVSGKGLPGALFMAVSKALCKSAALRHAGDVGAILREANAEISRDNPESLFVTVLAGVLEVDTGALEYCTAGHETPYLLRAGQPAARLPRHGGPALCVLDGYAYKAGRTRLAPDDVLCLTTDGVTEANDPGGALYGRARLEAVLNATGAGRDAQALGDALLADVRAFAGAAEASDDLAILILRWRGGAAG